MWNCTAGRQGAISCANVLTAPVKDYGCQCSCCIYRCMARAHANLVAHDCGYHLSRDTCRAPRVAAAFLLFKASWGCSSCVALHPPKISVSHLHPQQVSHLHLRVAEPRFSSPCSQELQGTARTSQTKAWADFNKITQVATSKGLFKRSGFSRILAGF